MRRQLFPLMLIALWGVSPSIASAQQAQIEPDHARTEALKQAEAEDTLEREDQIWFNRHHDEIFESLFPDLLPPEHAPWSFRFVAAPSFSNWPRMDLLIWTDRSGLAWIRYRAPFSVGIEPQVSTMRRADSSLTMERVNESFMREELTLSAKDWPELPRWIRSLQKVEMAPQPSDPFAVTVMVDGAGYLIEIKDGIQKQTFNLGSGQYTFSDLEFPDPKWGPEHPLIHWAQRILVELHQRWIRQELDEGFPDIPKNSLRLFHRDLLAASISERNLDWMRWMLSHDPDAGVSASDSVLTAAQTGCSPCLDLLLALGADPRASEHGETIVSMAAWRGDAAMVEKALKLGVNPNSFQYVPPIQAAATRGSASTVRVLLAYGARTDLKDDSGRTLLSSVREAEKALKAGDADPYPDILGMLIKAGARE